MQLTADGAARLVEQIELVLFGPGVTREWDEKFLTDLLGRLRQYGAKARISPKQWEQIERIIPDWQESAEAELNPNRYPYEATRGRSPHQN